MIITLWLYICTQHQRERLEIHDMAAAVFK
jgi:hypothetical protein